MIMTDIKHVDHQLSMTDALQKAIAFLRQPDIHLLSDGRVDIDGQDVFAIVQRYETLVMEVPKFEFHRKYIDIQYIVSGEEVIGWLPADRMAVTDAYNADKDICFGAAPNGETALICLRAGQLAVLYPEDGHAPKLAAEAPSRVFKIVVKVAVSPSLTIGDC